MTAIPDARVIVPPLPPRYVSRPRLLIDLDSAVARPLTLIAAGAGSGKTVLLSEWARTRSRPPAWVSLGATEDDPHRFWSLVADAFRASSAPNIEVESQEPFPVTIDHARVIDSYLTAATDDEPLILILDDAHILTNPLVLTALDGLLRRGWTRLRIILSARIDPLLALHRYRLAGQMAEIRAADLAMTTAEATDLLASHGITLSPREFNVLATRTEGWVAGLRLSAMSMEGGDHPEEFVSEFALDQGSVGEYLMNEVLDRQPAEVRTLLIETSFLNEINGDLAEAVTGIPGAGDWLAELSRTNSFVLPLDRSAGRFRYHQLFGEILRYLLRRQPSEDQQLLFSRAAAWYFGHDRLAEALTLAVDNQDWDHVASMLVDGGIVQSFINREDLRFLRDRDLVMSEGPQRNDLTLSRAALQLLAGRVDAAHRSLDLARQQIESGADQQALLAFLLTDLLLARAEHRIQSVADLSAQVLTLSVVDEHRALEAAVAFELGAAYYSDGRFDDADSALGAAYEHACKAEHPGLQLRCLSMLALVHAHLGRFRSSLGDEQRAEALVRGDRTLHAPVTLHLAAAIRSLWRAEFHVAMRSLKRAELRISEADDVDVRALTQLIKGVLLAKVGQAGPAQLALSLTLDSGGTMIEDLRRATLAELETALGRPHTAVKLLTSADEAGQSGRSAVMLARAHLALNEPGKAEDCLRPILAATEARGTRVVLIEALTAHAAVALANGEEDRAVEDLIRACELSAGEILLPFLGTDESLLTVVARHESLAQRWPNPLSDVIDLPDEGDLDLPRMRLPEQLTDRERTVLRWLSTSMSTTEIADELCLSVNTVKTHIAAIYRKLAAAKRRDAVLRARALELL